MSVDIKREIARAYSRGYNAARAGRWPDGVPPIPDEIVLQLAKAAKLARDTMDGELAKMDPGDEWENVFGPAIDAVDEALAEITSFAMQNINARGS